MSPEAKIASNLAANLLNPLPSPPFMKSARSFLALVFCLSCFFAGQAEATIRIILTADRLNNAAGNAAAATSSLVLVIADTDDDGLTVQPGAIALNGFVDGSGGDDLIIDQMDLSAFSIAGVLFESTPALSFGSDPNSKWGPDDDIYVIWFPTLTNSSTSVPGGTAYGSVLMGATPTEGATVSLTYLSTSNSSFFGTGSQANTAANQSPYSNSAPSQITLTGNQSIPENSAAAVVGTLGAVDPDAGDTATFALVSGQGSGDNASFNITGTTLNIVGSANFEAKSSYGIRIRATDQGGLSFEQPFTVTITNVNETPTNIALSAATLAEGNTVNDIVGTFTSSDPDATQSFTYTLVSGVGSTDNASFSISGATLNIGVVADYETKSSYNIRVRSTDAGGLFFEKAFVINVSDTPETTTVINITGSSAFRSVINQAIIRLLGGPSQCKYAYTGTGGSSGSETAIFEGISGPNRYIVRTLLKGSGQGIADLINQAELTDYLDPAATASDRIIGGRLIDPAGKTSPAIPRLAFSDIDQSFTRTPSPALIGQPVAVLPLIFVANPGAPASLTNVTDQLFQLQWALGDLSLSTYTGTVGQNTRIVNVGGDSLNGMRSVIHSETKYGPFTMVVQRSGVDNLTGVEGTGSVTSLGNRGDAGYSTASALRSVLARRSASVDIDGEGAQNVALVGYLPLFDAAAITDVTGGSGIGAVDLKYNGVAYSEGNIKNGAYTLWDYEQLYQALDISPAEASFVSSLVPRISEVMDPTANGVRLSDMNVTRYGGAGGPVLP